MKTAAPKPSVAAHGLGLGSSRFGRSGVPLGSAIQVMLCLKHDAKISDYSVCCRLALACQLTWTPLPTRMGMILSSLRPHVKPEHRAHRIG
jgi:hypothetical protein